MDSVMVFIPVEVERDAVIDVFACALDWESWSPEGASSTWGRVYTYLDHSVSADDYLDSPQAWEQIQALKSGETSNWQFDYSMGTVAMHHVLVALARRWPRLVLDLDGHAAPMSGTDFLARAQEAGGWDWRENPESGFEAPSLL